jgi:hypothetical protein
MDAANIIALCFGIIGAVTGSISLYFARRSAISSEQSALAAEKTVDHLIQVYQKQNRADLEFVAHDGRNRFHATEHSQVTTPLNFRVFNPGPASAHSIQLNLRSGQEEFTSGIITDLQSQETKLFSNWVELNKVPRQISNECLLELMYLDGNSPHVEQNFLRINGNLGNDEQLVILFEPWQSRKLG